MLADMRPTLVPVVLLPLLLLTACSAGTNGNGAASPSSASPSSSSSPSSPDSGPSSGATGPDENAMTITVDPGNGAQPAVYTLGCAPSPEETLPDPAAACAHLQGLDDPFAAVPADALCSGQYGGPQTAHITGRWAGQPVDLTLSRTDGCHISQWDRLGPLLPRPGRRPGPGAGRPPRRGGPPAAGRCAGRR